MPLKYPVDLTNRQPPQRWDRILAVDVHAEWEPLRVILRGFPDLPGGTVLDPDDPLRHGFLVR